MLKAGTEDLTMWVIFFDGVPHFWLIGGEVYRVGKKDCHIMIQDDRSISRTHLTIQVGLAEAPDLDCSRDKVGNGNGSSDASVQPIILLDSSTYGTRLQVRECSSGVESTTNTKEKVQRGGGDDDSSLREIGIAGLRYTLSKHQKRSRSGDRAPTLEGEHHKNDTTTVHNSESRLTHGEPHVIPVSDPKWREFSVVLGNHGAVLKFVWVDIAVLCEEIEKDMQMKLTHSLRCCGIRQETLPVLWPATTTPLSPGDVEEGECNSSSLALSQRGTVNGMESARTNPAPSPRLQRDGPTAACVSYPRVNFFVTSCLAPSTTAVAMLCCGIPIVQPSFFAAIRQRSSPQVPLPDPHRFAPPVCDFWLTLLPPPSSLSGKDSVSAEGDDGRASTTPPHLNLSNWLFPSPHRQCLFSGVTFVVLQQSLYEEVVFYMGCSQGHVLYDNSLATIGQGCDEQKALSTLQTFITRHEQHCVLFNIAEVTPFEHCVCVLQERCGLWCVEYAQVIQAVVLGQPLAPPAVTHKPHVPLELREEWLQLFDKTGNDGRIEPAEGRRTNPLSLFPELDSAAQQLSLAGEQGRTGASKETVAGVSAVTSPAPPSQRRRQMDEEGWVTFGAADFHSAKSSGRHTTPYSYAPQLPPYPCFELSVVTQPSDIKNGTGVFKKQSLCSPEPLVELEVSRAHRQLSASMLTARMPAVDGDSVLPQNVVMGSGGTSLNTTRGATTSYVAAANPFNVFDTAAHNASSKKKTSATRRGRGARHSTVVSSPPPSVAVSGAGDPVEAVGRVPDDSNRGGGLFQIFDIDGIF